MDGNGRRRLPIGVDNFASLICNNGYYADKTHLIGRLIDNVLPGGAMLFTRPRRFGKSLAISMLRRFFDCNEKEKNRPLFDGLAVSQSKRYMEEQGKYPVICFDFKTAKGSSPEYVVRNLRNAFLEALLPFDYLTRSDRLSQLEQAVMSKLLSSLIAEAPVTLATLNSVSTSLGLVCSFLAKHHDQPVVILIDEYDAPLQSAYAHGFYQPICDVMRNFFSSALKSNDHLRLGVVTGVLRITKDSLFSGLNNLDVDTILSKDYAHCFGFTQAEVNQLAQDYAVPDKIKEIQELYDGYRFGNQDIYNPWSVLKYFKAYCEPQAYWLDTASNDLVIEALHRLSETEHNELQDLYEGGYVEASVDTSVTFPQLKSENINVLYSLMAVSGYLKPVECIRNNRYNLKIPNREIRTIYADEILSYLEDGLHIGDLNVICDAIVQGQAQRFTELLNKYLMASISYYDTTERFYHGWMMGLLFALDEEYVCQSNREAGCGHSDIMLEPRPGRNLPGVIFELKHCAKSEQMPEKAAEALWQIEDRRYDAEFPPDVKKVLKYGIAFCGKECSIATL